MYNSPSVKDNRIKKILWENFILSFKTNKIKPKIFHSTNYTIPTFLSSDIKIIATVHDINWIVYPHLISKFSYEFSKMRMKYTCDNANKIIAISKSTKNDLINHLNCNSEKIKVIYQGINLDKFQVINESKELKKVSAKYNLPNKFLFWIGSLRKNKNVKRLCDGFIKSQEKAKEDWKLILAGSKSNGYSDVKELIESNSSLIKHIGFIEDEDLPYIYNLSSGLIFPSLYEGFGYPIVEAMACGKRVITSDRSSMPELVLEKEYLVNPESVNDIADKIYKLINNQPSSNQIKKLRKHAEKFDSSNTAKKTYELYLSVSN